MKCRWPLDHVISSVACQIHESPVYDRCDETSIKQTMDSSSSSSSSSSESSIPTDSDSSDASWRDRVTQYTVLMNYFRKRRKKNIEAPRKRQRVIEYDRLDLETFTKRHLMDPSFERWIRMRRSSFSKLTDLLRDQLSQNENGETLRGGVISPEMCVFLTLRYLAGNSYLCIKFSCSINVATFYHCMNKTLEAICNCPHLDIAFPTSIEDCEKLAGGFQSLSKKGAIVNCVGAVDGYLLSIQAPSKRSVSNARSYFSGHYSKFGVNIQAMCDSNCIFTYFAVSAPGATNDRVAIREQIAGKSLHDFIENLPEDYVAIADAAYESTEHCVSIFYGAQRTNPAHDNFNFCASQCRIRIEMAFGIMQSKWTILKRPLPNDIHNVKFVALAIARLHNFTLKESTSSADEEYSRLHGREFQATLTNQHSRVTVDTPVETAVPVVRRSNPRASTGTSNIRDVMVVRVEQLGIHRPTKSRRRLNNQNVDK